MKLRHLPEFELRGRRVIHRCYRIGPLMDGVITDDGRIRASLPTLRLLLEQGASVVILAHLGRPKGEPKPELSLEPVGKRLSELIDKEVKFASSPREAESAARALHEGEILLIENIRFEAAETSKESVERDALAEVLSRYGDFYVGDGFGAVHRKHASVFELAEKLPHAAGLLVEEEVRVLQTLLDSPNRPFAVDLGGAKVSDKIAVIRNLVERVDLLVIGGGMLFTFLAAEGLSVG